MGYKPTTHSTSFQDVLVASPLLKRVLQKAEEVKRLNQIVLKNLEPELIPYCRVTNLQDGILILTTSSPTWGHQLRFTTPTLLTTLRADPQWCGLKSIKIHVRPNDEKLPVALPALPYPILSKKGADCLKQILKEITHPELRKALTRLTKRYKAIK